MIISGGMVVTLSWDRSTNADVACLVLFFFRDSVGGISHQYGGTVDGRPSRKNIVHSCNILSNPPTLDTPAVVGYKLQYLLQSTLFSSARKWGENTHKFLHKKAEKGRSSGIEVEKIRQRFSHSIQLDWVWCVCSFCKRGPQGIFLPRNFASRTCTFRANNAGSPIFSFSPLMKDFYIPPTTQLKK